MAGAASHYVYSSDNGTDYRALHPTWVAGVQTATAATTEPTLPKGMKPRRRYFRITSSGKERSVVVFSAADTLYTAAFGTALSMPTLGSGTATACTLTGRTGEKTKAI
jgi:hypothetical protein